MIMKMENLEEEISFHVAGTKVHTTRTFTAAGSDGGVRADGLFGNYQRFLRDDLNSNAVCVCVCVSLRERECGREG